MRKEREGKRKKKKEEGRRAKTGRNSKLFSVRFCFVSVLPPISHPENEEAEVCSKSFFFFFQSFLVVFFPMSLSADDGRGLPGSAAVALASIPARRVVASPPLPKESERRGGEGRGGRKIARRIERDKKKRKKKKKKKVAEGRQKGIIIFIHTARVILSEYGRCQGEESERDQRVYVIGEAERSRCEEENRAESEGQEERCTEDKIRRILSRFSI